LQWFASTSKCVPGTVILEVSEDLFRATGESVDGIPGPTSPKQAWQECKAFVAHRQTWHEAKTELKSLCNQTEDSVAQLEDSNIHPDVNDCVRPQPDIIGLDATWPSRDESKRSHAWMPRQTMVTHPG
jgi:hypothetical protein